MSAIACDSGIECVIGTYSTRNAPSCRESPGATWSTGTTSRRPASASFSRRSVAANGVASTGQRSRGQRWCTAPWWSSWACVSTIASIRSSMPSSARMSGITTSASGIRSSRNVTPQSIMSQRPAYP